MSLLWFIVARPVIRSLFFAFWCSASLGLVSLGRVWLQYTWTTLLLNYLLNNTLLNVLANLLLFAVADSASYTEPIWLA